MSSISGTQANQCSDFTDRTECLQRWEEVIHEQHSAAGDALNACRVMVWHGLGGCGTSRLMAELCERVVARNGKSAMAALSVVDFNDMRYHAPLEAILKLYRDIRHHSDISFPTFEFAILHLLYMQNPGMSFFRARQKLHETLGRESSLLMDLAQDVINTVASTTTYSSPYFYMGLVFSWGRKLTGYSVARLKSWFEDPEIKVLCSEIEVVRTECALQQNLPRYFGFDLRRALHKAESPLRVVWMFDHYHMLNTGRHTSRSVSVQWLRSLIQETPGALVAIFSRHKLDWDKSDMYFKRPGALEQQELTLFEEVDADSYLKRKGIKDAAVRARIVELANCTPGLLALLVDRFHHMRTNGRQPEAEDFNATFEDVLEISLDHLEERERSYLRLASYPEAIDESMFLDLASAFSGDVIADWYRLASLSLMRQDNKGGLIMSPTLREQLQNGERRRRPETFRRIHQWLFERYFKTVDAISSAREISEEHDKALVCAVRHLSCFDASRLYTVLLTPGGKLHEFFEATRWQALSVVFEIVERLDEPLGSIADQIKFHFHHAHVLQWMGHLERAKPYYELALELHEKAFPSSALAERATFHHALGDVLYQLGVKGSKKHYEAAWKLYQDDPDMFEQRRVDILFSLGLLYDAAEQRGGGGEKSNLMEASECYELAATMNRKLHGPKSKLYGHFLAQLGQSHKTYHRMGEAEEAFREALDILASIEDDRPHMGYGPMLLEVADCAANKGDDGEAEGLFERAIPIFEKYGGLEHPNLGYALHRQAMYWSRQDTRLTEASHQLQRAVDILKSAAGQEHIWTKQAIVDLQAISARIPTKLLS